MLASSGSTIEIFTVISLMIGLFGATYTAIATLRRIFANKISQKKELADEHIKYITNSSMSFGDQLQGQARKNFTWLKRLVWVWYFIADLPAGVFFFLTFTAGFYIGLKNDIPVSVSWSKSQNLILLFTILYLSCIVLTIILFFIIHCLSWALNNKNLVAEELERKGLGSENTS